MKIDELQNHSIFQFIGPNKYPKDRYYQKQFVYHTLVERRRRDVVPVERSSGPWKRSSEHVLSDIRPGTDVMVVLRTTDVL